MFTDLISSSVARCNDAIRYSDVVTFDDLFKSFDELMNSSRLSFQEPFPPVNVFYRADDKTAEITLALAGYSKDELSVTVDGDRILIEASPIKEEEKAGTYMKRRIHKTAFKRSYELPHGVYDMEKVDVEYNNGLLTITVPSKEKETPAVKKIAIR